MQGSALLTRRRLLGVAVSVASVGIVTPAPAISYAPRSISLYNTHTGEWLRTVYWADGHYIREADPRRLVHLLIPILRKQGLLSEPPSFKDEWLEQLVCVLRDRSKTLLEMAEKASPFLSESIFIEPSAQKFLTESVKPALTGLCSVIEQSSFDHAELERGFKVVLQETGLSMNQLAQPVRAALTGRTVSPGIFDVMLLLGRERTLSRLRKAIDLIRGDNDNIFSTQ